MDEINIKATKITMPLITDAGLDAIDNNLHSIINDFLKYKIHDNDLYLAQYIMKKLEEENQELKVLNRRYKEIISDDEENYKLFSSEINELKAQQKEFIKYLEDQKKRLVGVPSQIYTDSLGKTKKVNEDIFNKVNEILEKYKEIIGSDKE